MNTLQLTTSPARRFLQEQHSGKSAVELRALMLQNSSTANGPKNVPIVETLQKALAGGPVALSAHHFVLLGATPDEAKKLSRANGLWNQQHPKPDPVEWYIVVPRDGTMVTLTQLDKETLKMLASAVATEYAQRYREL